MSWLIYAFMASVLWGLTYVLGELLYQRISVLSTLFLTNIMLTVCFGALSLRGRVLQADVRTLVDSPRAIGMIILLSAVWIGGEFSIASSIAGKNAVLAGLIEITYPLWIVAFSAAIIGSSRVTPAVGLGAVLIFAGVAVIAWSQK